MSSTVKITLFRKDICVFSDDESCVVAASAASARSIWWRSERLRSEGGRA